jgi:hypothetical protein
MEKSKRRIRDEHAFRRFLHLRSLAWNAHKRQPWKYEFEFSPLGFYLSTHFF